jgi:hypothetical protein
MVEEQFQKDISALHLLAQNDESLDEFCAFGLKILTQLYNEMSQVRNTDKLLTGQIKARGQMIKTIVELKLQSLGMTWPERSNKSA